MNLIYGISIGLVALGLILFFLSYFWIRNKRKGIDHYTQKRDELTTRKEKDYALSDYVHDGLGGSSIVSLISGFVIIAVGLSLLPTISEQVSLATNMSNLTGSAAGTLLSITQVFFAIAIALAAIGIAANAFRQSGVI